MSRTTNMMAWTKNPNTPETDAMRRVEHVVKFKLDGEQREVVVRATDPLDAMNMVERQYIQGDER